MVKRSPTRLGAAFPAEPYSGRLRGDASPVAWLPRCIPPTPRQRGGPSAL